MSQLEKLQQTREQIKAKQSGYENGIEQLLLEMQRRHWLSHRGILEKREVIATLSELQSAMARGIDDRRTDGLVLSEQERLKLKERERDHISSIYQRDLVNRQSELLT